MAHNLILMDHSGIFHLIFLHSGLLWVTENVESKTTGERDHCLVPLATQEGCSSHSHGAHCLEGVAQTQSSVFLGLSLKGQSKIHPLGRRRGWGEFEEHNPLKLGISPLLCWAKLLWSPSQAEREVPSWKRVPNKQPLLWLSFPSVGQS